MVPAGSVLPGDDSEVLEETEVVLARAVPADGRSRGYVDGKMATMAALTELGDRLVDLHGQHEHQSLFAATAAARRLDAFAAAGPWRRDDARRQLRQLEEAMSGGAGDSASRAAEMELLRYQLSELQTAGLTSPQEDDDLAAEEERLARGR